VATGALRYNAAHTGLLTISSAWGFPSWFVPVLPRVLLGICTSVVCAYERHIAPEQHTIGKAQTQKIESKHINLRMRIKRLVRRTICFSKTTTMHDLVIGLFINRYEFGRSI
jgi:IS1 transposase